jgi:phospholipid-binding lipoprotein MlaA
MTTTHRHSVTPRFQALLELPSQRLSRPFDMALAIFLLLLLTCSPAYAANEYDPFEKVNRVTFGFNVALDRAILKPLASGYDNYTPKEAKTGVRNFFNNLDDLRVGVNDLLQLNFTQAVKDFGRFAVNSTVGVAGLFDVAEPALNLDKNRQDFGKTLAHWGVGSGPYLVLPVIGPNTARDALGFSVDTMFDPLPSIDHVSSRNSLLATKSTDRRADYLSFDNLIIGDDYLFVRGIYLQSRKYSINGSYAEIAFDDF